MNETSPPTKTSPKVFISYSWTTPEHEEWVVNLAKELRESGVDVILDKWELREGADKYAFMEKMVTDPDVQKVIMVCDKAYVEKANKRKGGVGTETQIISPELYEQADPTHSNQKFVAVVREYDNGKPCTPAYYKGRIHIEMVDEQARAENFEQLVRWIFDKPLHVKPALGKAPAYLIEDKITLGTSAQYTRALDALIHGKPHAMAATQEYFEKFAENLENFRMKIDSRDKFDDIVVENIKSFLSSRDQAIDVFIALAKYQPNEEAYSLLHNFLGQILPYTDRMHSETQRSSVDFDNFKLIVHELFLYAVAALLKYERFEGVNYLLGQGYYFMSPDYGGKLVSFIEFEEHLASLDVRNKRLNLNRISVHADLLKERAYRKEITFEQLMQADYVTFLRASLGNERWWPKTLVFANWRRSYPFEVFVKSISQKYFSKAKAALGLENVEPLKKLISDFKEGKKHVPRFDYDSVNVSGLCGIEDIATKP